MATTRITREKSGVFESSRAGRERGLHAQGDVDGASR